MTAAVWLGACIFMAWTIEAMSGFGSIVIALSLGALLLPIDSMLPVLVVLNVMTSSWLGWQHRRHIDHALLWRRILPAMLLGTLAGAFLRDLVPGVALKIAFAILILWFALRELFLMRSGQLRTAHGDVQTHVLLAGAGISHGLFASGGPLLVYALAGRSMEKARFRATLVMVWLLLNGVLALIFLGQGSLQAHARELLFYMPVVALAVGLGNYLHHRLDEDRFRVMVFWLLLLVGAALLLSPLLNVLH